jgi:hypothetical protein
VAAPLTPLEVDSTGFRRRAKSRNDIAVALSGSMFYRIRISVANLLPALNNGTFSAFLMLESQVPIEFVSEVQ